MRRILLLSPILLAIFVILIVTATYNQPDDLADANTTPSGTEVILTPTHTLVTSTTTVTIAPPSPDTSPIPAPDRLYTVQVGDTLWSIANLFERSTGEIMSANPELNPAGLIFPGDLLVIPSSQGVVATITAEAWSINGQVTAEGSGLRLREGPSLNHKIILELAALTPLSITGRTADNSWLQVRTTSEDSGWVFAEWVDVFIDLEDIPMSNEEFPPEVPSDTPDPTEATSTPHPPSRPSQYPYITGISEHVQEIFSQGLALGNRPNVFSKVGDSITYTDAFLYPIGWNNYRLHEHAYLQPVIDFYSEEWARTHNSFANYSLAANIGWSAHALLTSAVSHETHCGETETPLDCEYRLVKPSIALIMLGTNDVPSTPLASYENAMRQITETTIEYGIIPILSTIPSMQMTDTEGRVEAINAIITDLAREYDIPLLDLWAALEGLPDHGLRSDGVHLSLAPAGQNAYFTPENLQYGMPVRSLTAVQALDLVWRAVLPEGQ